MKLAIYIYIYIYVTEMAVYVTCECHMRADISGWLDLGLQYLQCINNEDAAVLHQAINKSTRALARCLTGTRPLSLSLMT